MFDDPEAPIAPPEVELPQLSSAELAAHFAGDTRALRRYRILTALIHEQRSVNEVARTFNISREGVRRLRLAYTRDGLDALRSRRGGGHIARGTPLARAVAEEISARPNASAAQIVARVQERMARLGLPAPRSTIYRLLAILRDDDEDERADGELDNSLLRAALEALAEDPPLELGRSELASLFLPSERDVLVRGRLLQAALREAIARMRPSNAQVSAVDEPRWRHYLILAGEYETGEDRAALQKALVLSASSYTRAKRDALERLMALLPETLTEQYSAPPSAIISPPPSAPIDREPELESYSRVLRHSGLSIIWGPDTQANTALASMIASRLRDRGQVVVWHAGRIGEAAEEQTIDPTSGSRLLATLAAALALDGERDLWEQIMAQDGPPAEPQQLAEQITARLAGRRWTVVLADAERLRDHLSTALIDALRTAQQRASIRLLVVSRTLPGWADPLSWPPLPDADDSAARAALLARLGSSASRGERNANARRLDLPALQRQITALVSALPAVDTLDTTQRRALAEALEPLTRALAALIAEQ